MARKKLLPTQLSTPAKIARDAGRSFSSPPPHEVADWMDVTLVRVTGVINSNLTGKSPFYQERPSRSLKSAGERITVFFVI